MATFHGFKITSMRSWEGMEGIGTSGNLYWGNRKLGKFIDYGDGGTINFHFPHSELDKAIREECPNLTQEAFGYDPISDMGGLSTLVLHLADLTDREKALRKAWRWASRDGLVLACAYAGNSRYDFALDGAGQSDDDMVAYVTDYLAVRNETADRVEVWRSQPTIDEFPQPVTGVAAQEEAKRATALERDARRRMKEAKAHS